MTTSMYSYKDIVLVPNYSTASTRSSLDVSVSLGEWDFRSPAIPANMACTISFEKAEELAENGYFYILHRFYDYGEILRWVAKRQRGRGPISISVGINEKDFQLIQDLHSYKVDFITIDVAHGHHERVRGMIAYIKARRPDTFVIAGNIGSVRAAVDLAEWGADAVKVGLSMGKSCTTYNATGVGTPMFTIVHECCEECPVPVIADGQVREVGDIGKALVAGASMVMIGSEFAKCKDSPAEVDRVMVDFSVFRYDKLFYGSASVHNGNMSYVEGAMTRLQMEDYTMLEYFDKIRDGVQSTMSYLGISRIENLHLASWRTRLA